MNLKNWLLIVSVISSGILQADLMTETLNEINLTTEEPSYLPDLTTVSQKIQEVLAQVKPDSEKITQNMGDFIASVRKQISYLAPDLTPGSGFTVSFPTVQIPKISMPESLFTLKNMAKDYWNENSQALNQNASFVVAATGIVCMVPAINLLGQAYRTLTRGEKNLRPKTWTECTKAAALFGLGSMMLIKVLNPASTFHVKCEQLPENVA